MKWCAVSALLACWGDHCLGCLWPGSQAGPVGLVKIRPLVRCDFRTDESSLGKMCSRSVGRCELLYEAVLSTCTSSVASQCYLFGV